MPSLWPAPPQLGRHVAPDTPPTQRGLWGHVLAAVRDLGGALDPFTNDASAEVRALGLLARRRHPSQSSDYFALGDLCARLTAESTSLNTAYANKTIIAYLRGGEGSVADGRTARSAVLDFVFWCANAAEHSGEYESTSAALGACERVEQLELVTTDSVYGKRLQATSARLRERLANVLEGAPNELASRTANQREARRLVDQGQTLLRQHQPDSALDALRQAAQLDEANPAVWLWQAMAYTDTGRFNEALASYDQALALDGSNAGTWNNQGMLLLELGKLSEAQVCFERALAHAADIAPVRALYSLNRGKALYMGGHYNEALAALTVAHTLDPSSESAAGVAACREQLGLAGEDTPP